MALVHHATLNPGKQELVESFLASRTWARGLEVTGKVAEYRFDDPAGEVGVETILWDTGNGRMIQTPLTYRAAPLAGAERFLIGTTEHSVLGTRWVYDGCGDPVWARTLVETIATGGSQAAMYFEDGGTRVDIPARMQVRGSGHAGGRIPAVISVDQVADDSTVTIARAGGVEIRVARTLGESDGTDLGDGDRLTGRIGDDGAELVLAVMRAG
jgi:hypothetical protein